MKRFVRPVFVLIYASALLFSALIAFKPGAAIFYYKIALQPENFHSDEGFAYRYKVELPPILFPAQKVLVFEDGQQLTRATGGEVIQSGNGIYTTGASAEGGFYIYIAPKENSDPTTNGRTYRLYCALSLLSQTLGILYFSTLLYGLYRFVRFASSPAARGKLHGLPGLLGVGGDFTLGFRAAASAIHASTQAPWRARLVDGLRLWALTTAAAYGLVFMEWLFQVTKASFMDEMSLGQKVEIFLLSGLALAAVSLALNAVLLLVEFLLRPLRLAWLAACAAAAVPAALLTTLVVLWLDHFTYTLFRFGILTTSNLLRTSFGIAAMLILFTLYRWVLGWWGLTGGARKAASSANVFSGAMLGLVVISIGLAVIRMDRQFLETGLAPGADTVAQELPNIILIGSDGVSARNMSLYGYTRDTTPQINRLAEVSLVAENAFTNSGNTHGSIGSIFTSKMPTHTGLLYPPDILQGADRYEHLPEILKDLGYTTVQLGVPYYVDAYMMNFQDGFDTVNQRSLQEDVLVQIFHNLGYDLPAYFIQAFEESFIDRFFHAFYVDTVENPFITVTQAASSDEDFKKIQDLLALFEKPGAPVFAHVHLMVTHGPTFKPGQQTFSAGKQQHMYWLTDFYDDAILTFDQYIGNMVDALKANGEYDNTIIIIYTDHAMNWEFNERIPLLIHFPADQHQGRIQANVQNLDIAPTVLDYLGMPIPAWMEGQSILQPGLEERELILAVATDAQKAENAEAGAPGQSQQQLVSQNYQYSTIQVINCQRWYKLDLIQFEWTSGDIFQHTAPCAEGDLLDMAQIRQAVVQDLAEQGFDTAPIP